MGSLNLMVPNVPCGVESVIASDAARVFSSVPNVPCGVESWEEVFHSTTVAKKVPNVPCGVERLEDVF